jgi:hypothetical protein
MDVSVTLCLQITDQAEKALDPAQSAKQSDTPLRDFAQSFDHNWGTFHNFTAPFSRTISKIASTQLA